MLMAPMGHSALGRRQALLYTRGWMSTMLATTPLLSLPETWTEVLPWVYRRLSDAGLEVRQTFDLRLARCAQLDCPCPHHGTAECDCQMLILLVYRSPAAPVTLIIHGSDASTWIYMVDVPGHRADALAQGLIRRLLILSPSLDSGVDGFL